MDYIVTCLDDQGERVRATRRTFDKEGAEHYASTVCATREPEVDTLCIFCGVEWRTAMDESNDWPRCINCRAC